MMHTTFFFYKQSKDKFIKLWLCLALTFLAFCATAFAQPNEPNKIEPIPDYGELNITVSWDPVGEAEEYRVYRAPVVGDDPGEYGLIGTVDHPVTEYADNPGTEDEFFYTVTAVDDQDEESEKPDGVRQSLRTLWSVPTSLCILHSFNEPSDTHIDTDNFHAGIDIRGPGGDQVVAARGGKISRVANKGTDNAGIDIRVKHGTQTYIYHWNHLDDSGNNKEILVDEDDIVYPGQPLGDISTEIWVAWVSHAHFNFADLAWTLADINPLSIYEENKYLDPQENPPAIANLNADEKDRTVLFLYQEQNNGLRHMEYDPEENPIPIIGNDWQDDSRNQGKMNFAVEIGDNQMTIAWPEGEARLEQAVTDIAYWIEGRRMPVEEDLYAHVRSGDTPYVLFDWSDGTFFGNANVVWYDIVDKKQEYGGKVSHEGQTYPWNSDQHDNVGLYRHYIITNTDNDDGGPTGVDADQYWNTNAENDPNIGYEDDEANFATKDITEGAHNARFPDGEYIVHVRMGDLIHTAEGKVEDSFTVRLENYPPIIVEVEVRQDADDEETPADGEDFERLIYEFIHENPNPYEVYEVDEEHLAQYQKGVAGSGKDDGRRLWVRIIFSETMDHEWAEEGEDPGFKLQLDPHGRDPIDFEDVQWDETYVENDTVTGMLTIPPREHEKIDSRGELDDEEPDHSHDAVIVVRARDLADAEGEHRGLDPTSDGTPAADKTDRNHRLKIDAKHDESPEIKLEAIHD